MQKHYNYLDIDLDNKNNYRRLNAMQGDIKTRYILVNLYSNNLAYDLSNCTVKIYGLKRDKTIFFNNAVITNEKLGQFEIELTNQALAVAGELKIQILVLGAAGEKLTSSAFFIDVGESIIDENAIESANEFNALTESLTKVNEWDSYFEETSGKIEEKYTERLNSVDSQIKDKSNLSNKRVVLKNTKDDLSGILELANFAGQGNLSNIIAFILHHYTDSDMIQLDNVGSGTTLVLKNAQNPSRRPDKEPDYVGDGAFLKLMEHNNELGYVNELMQITKDAEILFTGKKGTVVLSSNKDDNGIYAFNLKVYKDNEYLLNLTNGSKGEVLSVKNVAAKTRLDIESSKSQSNGLRVKTNVGSLDLVSGSTGNEDMLLKGKRIRTSFDNGSTYYNIQTTQGGTTANRPTFTVANQQYFDHDLNKPIWRNKNNNGWVDALGNPV